DGGDVLGRSGLCRRHGRLPSGRRGGQLRQIQQLLLQITPCGAPRGQRGRRTVLIGLLLELRAQGQRERGEGSLPRIGGEEVLAHELLDEGEFFHAHGSASSCGTGRRGGRGGSIERYGQEQGASDHAVR